jgi:integrase
MQQLREVAGIASRALEFTILTAARTNEVIQAEWSELDLDMKTWVVPAERMKSKRVHRVPLSDAAVSALKAWPMPPSSRHRPAPSELRQTQHVRFAFESSLCSATINAIGNFC